MLSESQWRADAAKVELEANHELNRLVGLLELDSAQQDKVFAALARHSSHWSPGMQTAGNLRAGGPGTASESAAPELPNVSDFLSADQQQTLIQEEMERQAWWEEVLPQLLPPTLQSDPIEPTVPTVDANPPPETKAFEGDGMLLEE